MPTAIADLAATYRAALLDDVIPFWEKHSLDRQYGGYFTCLDRAGQVFDTDKFTWLQARQVWLFAKMCNVLERRDGWLDMARCGAEFLERFGRNEAGDWYFSLTRKGEPLVQAYNWFSDSFAAIAFAQYHLATGDAKAGDIARQTFTNMLRRLPNPKGPYNKRVPGTRPLQSMAFPMILINLCAELEGVLPQDQLDQVTDDAVRQIMTLHLDPERGITFDNIAPDGAHVDCFEGRWIIPGHGIEAMWFVIDAARRRNRPEWIEPAARTILNLIEFGWDPEHGGIFYYLDTDNKPPQQLEWDQKLWWVHNETLIALLMAYRHTRWPACWQWFEKIHHYSWTHFADPLHGEWFGYLNRAGQVLIPLKGGKWKGCFHVPRALYCCWQELQAIARDRPEETDP